MVAAQKNVDNLDKLASQALTAWKAYLSGAKKNFTHAVQAGAKLEDAFQACRASGRVWAKWCDEQRAIDSAFPTRQWADNLRTFAKGWDIIKDREDIKSIEHGVKVIKGKDGPTKRIRSAPITTARVKTIAEQHHLNVDEFFKALKELGIEIKADKP